MMTPQEIGFKDEQQADKCNMSYEILYDFKYEKGTDAWIVESDLVKPNIERFALTKDEMPDGYTETTNIENLDKILEIVYKYNKHM